MSAADRGELPAREAITPDKQAKREEAELEDKKEVARVGKRGGLGRFFGGGREKAGNIAGLMAVLCFVAVVGLFAAALFVGLERVDAGLAGLAAAMSACLGYLFGRK